MVSATTIRSTLPTRGSTVTTFSRYAVALALAASSALKVSSGPLPSQLLPPIGHYSVSAAEMLIALVLFWHVGDRAVRISLVGAMIVAAAGMILALMSTASCGCFGSHIVLSPHQHLLVAGSLGVFAWLAYPSERSHP